MSSSRKKFDPSGYPVFKEKKYIKIFAGVLLEGIKDVLECSSNKFGNEKELQKAYRKVSEALSIIDGLEEEEKEL